MMQNRRDFENQNSKRSHRCCGQSPPPLLPSNTVTMETCDGVVDSKATPTPVCGMDNPSLLVVGWYSLVASVKWSESWSK